MLRSVPNPRVQYPIKAILSFYLRIYHRIECTLPPSLPKQGPLLALTSHFSLLDTVACMAVDPYRPLSTFVIKDSLMRLPLLGAVLRAWGAIPVAREGRDIGALRAIVGLLREGGTLSIAPEGERSRTGRLGPMHPVLMRLTAEIARQGVPIVPAAEIGTYEALPPGAWFPRPHKIRVILGEPIDLSRWTHGRVTDEQLPEIATQVRDAISALLPPERRPSPGTPVLANLATWRDRSIRSSR